MSDSKEDLKEDDKQPTSSAVPVSEQKALKSLVNLESTQNVNHNKENISNNANLTDKNNKNKPIYPYRVARLDDICVSFISSNFNSYPILDTIPLQYIMNIVHSIDLSKLEINRAAKHVECSKLWERMAHERWRNCTVELHGSSWKRLYLEKHITELLESYYPSMPDSNINLNRLLDSIKCAAPFIHSIKLNQLPSHLDLSQILPLFHNLSSVDVTYKTLNVGMNYNEQDFGMNLNDALNISKYLQTTKSLAILVLSECLIDDETIHILMGGLEKNKTMTTLDLSNNNISDVGARRLSTFLQKNNVLQILNLNNNKITDEGIQYIASTLTNKNNSCLIELDVSLNNINDLGAITLFESVGISESLQTLNISCNHVTNKSFEAFINMLKVNTTLHSLNISGNPLIGSISNHNISNSKTSSRPTSVSSSKTSSRPQSQYNNSKNNSDTKELKNCLLNENISIIDMNILHVGLSKLQIKTINKILMPRKVKRKQSERKNFLNKSWQRLQIVSELNES
eukprot:85713_1